MGKVIFWMVIIFVVLFCLRMYNVAQQKKRERRAAPPTGNDGGEAMVRCTRCGIFLPRSEAQLIQGNVRCREKDCR